MIGHQAPQAPQAGLVPVKYAGYKFEVVDIDSYKIDQLLVTRVEPIVTEKAAQES